MNITIAFITSRKEPNVQWFSDSLSRQLDGSCDIVIVDSHLRNELLERSDYPGMRFLSGRHWEVKTRFPLKHVAPKPTVWQGPHRLTKSDWWAKSNALNTALCLCREGWFAAVDDRCVLAPGWLDSVREAMAGNYAVCGAYEKLHNVVVENGVMVSSVEPVDEHGNKTGKDHRCDGHLLRARYCIPGWFFGCSIALPTEWALQVNGWNELLDGLGAEDTHFGHMLKNNGFDMRFDPRMKVIQDRTPGECGPEMNRISKERFPHDTQDKGHKAIELFFGEKQSSHPWKIREIRDTVLAGGKWPSVDKYPCFDWFDGQPIAEFP